MKNSAVKTDITHILDHHGRTWSVRLHAIPANWRDHRGTLHFSNRYLYIATCNCLTIKAPTIPELISQILALPQ